MPHNRLASLHGQLSLILFQPLKDRFPAFDREPPFYLLLARFVFM